MFLAKNKRSGIFFRAWAVFRGAAQNKFLVYAIEPFCVALLRITTFTQNGSICLPTLVVLEAWADVEHFVGRAKTYTFQKFGMFERHKLSRPIFWARKLYHYQHTKGIGHNPYFLVVQKQDSAVFALFGLVGNKVRSVVDVGRAVY